MHQPPDPELRPASCPVRRVPLLRASLITAALAVALVLSCSTDQVSGKRRFSYVHWTAKQEREMGAEFSPNIESEFEAIYPDAGANAYLGELVSRMVDQSPRREDFDFHFKILNSSVPNALALPGGYVYITRGLLSELESEGQFISVMGHELGHVEHRHAMLNQSRGPLDLTAGAMHSVGRALPIGGRVVGLAANIVAAPSVVLGLKFSRAQELEADERGVYFAAEMGYDPRDAVRTFELFEVLEQESGEGSSRFAIFRTHPVNSERIKRIEATVARDYPEWSERARPAAVETDAGGGPFLEIVRGLRAHSDAYELYDQASRRMTKEKPNLDAAWSELEEALALVPDEPLFWILQGELAIVSENAKAATRSFNEAVKLYRRSTPGDGHWKPHFYLGALALNAQQPQLAASHLEVAVERYPMYPAAHLLLGDARAARGDRKLAIEAYRAVLELTPKGAELNREARARLSELGG